jgi:GH25 family lysozyme M1 (1,4-beta-N-acetylmuramidase)
MTCSGPDVSSYQTKIDWPRVATASELAIVKVTEGNGYTNARATDQVTGAVSAGLLTCLYHFAQPNGPNWLEDAAAEAKRLDDLADAFEQKLGRKLFCFLDVERNEPLTPAEKPLWREWTAEFRRWCRDEGKRVIGWYSGAYFTKDLALEPDWCQTVLWLAQYPSTFRADCNYGFWPKTIAPWFRADVWQHGGGMKKAYGGNESTCPGIDGLSDFNTFAGSREELAQLIDAAA